jgi:hypothetical protein
MNHILRDGQKLPKVFLGLVIPNPSMPCGQPVAIFNPLEYAKQYASVNPHINKFRPCVGRGEGGKRRSRRLGRQPAVSQEGTTDATAMPVFLDNFKDRE